MIKINGYPKYIATKQDFFNLLVDEKFKSQAVVDLKKIYYLDDSKATKATTLADPANPMGDWNTEIIDNPMPLWKQKGFSDREEIKELIDSLGQ